MSWILSILILLYIVFSFASIFIADATECMDHKWSELDWYEKCANVINYFNITVICIFVIVVFVIGIHYILMEIPAIKEFFIKHEWN